MLLRVLHPSFGVRYPASGIVCAEHNSHNIEDDKPLLYTYICYVCRLYSSPKPKVGGAAYYVIIFLGIGLS